MPMAARHGALPETLAVAQGAVFIPLETLGFIVAPVLGIAILRERATGRRSAYCRHFLPGRC